MKPALLAVAIDLLDEQGWQALGLDQIAARAGVSRATVWRAGVTRAAVERVLRQRLATDYHVLMSRAVTMPGPATDRFAAALVALCEVAERNLALLAHTDTAFHHSDLDAAGVELDFFGPWLPIIEDAVSEGGLEPIDDVPRFVTALSNTVLLPYVHLRAHHLEYGWSADQARDHVLGLVARGYLKRG